MIYICTNCTYDSSLSIFHSNGKLHNHYSLILKSKTILKHLCFIINASENYILLTATPNLKTIITSWNGQSIGKDQVRVDIPRRKSHSKKKYGKSIRKGHDTICS